ncbi:MAG: hypothetical protein AABY68_12960 [Pseudomonadota bacterium]
MPNEHLVDLWAGTKKSDDSSKTYSDEESVVQPTENPPVQDFQGAELVTGSYLKSLLIEDTQETDCGLEPAGNLSDIVLLRPVLLVKQPDPVITGDISYSTLLIRRLNPELLYPVIWVSRAVKAAQDKKAPTPKKTSKPIKTSQLSIPNNALSKGEIAQREAESLGISRAALRKRKSRERSRGLADDKK